MNEIVPPNEQPRSAAEELEVEMPEDAVPAVVDEATAEVAVPEMTLQSDENAVEDASLRETLKDIGSRVPNYARLSQGLVSAGLMSANQQSQVLGPLGSGPLAQVTRFVPLLSQVTRVLQLVGAVHFALTQLDREVADQHLELAGLTRQQVEADFETTRGLAARAAESGGEQASRVLEIGAEHASQAYELGREQVVRAVDAGKPVASEALREGARRAGRLTGKSIVAFRRWQAKSADGNPPRSS